MRTILCFMLLIFSASAFSQNIEFVKADEIRSLFIQDIPILEKKDCLKDNLLKSSKHLSLISTGCFVNKVALDRSEDSINFTFNYSCMDGSDPQVWTYFSCQAAQ